jgi:hypothetical protein
VTGKTKGKTPGESELKVVSKPLMRYMNMILK